VGNNAGQKRGAPNRGAQTGGNGTQCCRMETKVQEQRQRQTCRGGRYEWNAVGLEEEKSHNLWAMSQHGATYFRSQQQNLEGRCQRCGSRLEACTGSCVFSELIKRLYPDCGGTVQASPPISFSIIGRSRGVFQSPLPQSDVPDGSTNFFLRNPLCRLYSDSKVTRTVIQVNPLNR
jgi:hypothetical protein